MQSSGRRCSRPPNAPDPPLIFVVVGPGGVGKGTIVAELTRRDPALWLSRSWTTRPRRAGEAEDAYVFVDSESFERRVSAGGFLEWARVLDHYYGTPTPDPPEGRDVLLEIDVQGAAQVLAVDPSAVVILLVAPSPETLEARLRARGDPDEHVTRRLALAEHEVAEAKQFAQHVVVNDDLERALAQLSAIIEAARRQ